MLVYTRKHINDAKKGDNIKYYCLNDLLDLFGNSAFIWRNRCSEIYIIRILGMESGEFLLFNNLVGVLRVFNIHNQTMDYDPRAKVWMDVTDRKVILFEVVDNNGFYS